MCDIMCIVLFTIFNYLEKIYFRHYKSNINNFFLNKTNTTIYNTKYNLQYLHTKDIKYSHLKYLIFQMTLIKDIKSN